MVNQSDEEWRRRLLEAWRGREAPLIQLLRENAWRRLLNEEIKFHYPYRPLVKVDDYFLVGMDGKNYILKHEKSMDILKIPTHKSVNT